MPNSNLNATWGTPITWGGFTSQEVSLPASFVPKVKKYKLRYSAEVQIDASATQVAAYVFRCNSLYDPDFTGFGHSAYMFDDIMRLYRRYRVVGSKIKVWHVTPTGVQAGPMAYMTILRSSSGIAYTSFASSAHILESNIRGNVKLIGHINDAVVGGLYKPTCTSTFSQRKVFPGIKDLQLEGPWDNNPEKVYYWEVVLFNVAGNNPDIQQLRVEIDFTAVFSEPILLSMSGVDDTGLGIGGGPAIGSTGTQALFASGDGGELGNTGPAGGIN